MKPKRAEDFYLITRVEVPGSHRVETLKWGAQSEALLQKRVVSGSLVVILGGQIVETPGAVAAKRANRKRGEASERMARSVGERGPEGETPWVGPA